MVLPTEKAKMPPEVDCHPEAAESPAQASDSQRRISVLITEHDGLIRAGTKNGCPISRVLCEKWDAIEKNDYRGILAGLGGVSGKKAVDRNHDGQELNRSYGGPSTIRREGHGFSHATKAANSIQAPQGTDALNAGTILSDRSLSVHVQT
jgi:hypothetical protein